MRIIVCKSFVHKDRSRTLLARTDGDVSMGIPDEFAVEFACPSTSRLINTAIRARRFCIFYEGKCCNAESGRVIGPIIGYHFKHTDYTSFAATIQSPKMRR